MALDGTSIFCILHFAFCDWQLLVPWYSSWHRFYRYQWWVGGGRNWVEVRLSPGVERGTGKRGRIQSQLARLGSFVSNSRLICFCFSSLCRTFHSIDCHSRTFLHYLNIFHCHTVVCEECSSIREQFSQRSHQEPPVLIKE